MEIFRVDIKDPMESMIISKNKYYLNANLFYSGLNHHIQKLIVTQCKLFLHNHLFDCPKIETFPIDICLIYTHPRNNFDLDNKAYFWQKIIGDKLRDDKKIPDDNVKFIHGWYLEYDKGEKPCLSIIISVRS